MSAQDMRDVMGIEPSAIRPPPAKKRKLAEKRTLEKGISREVSALMGERAPPVSMIQVQPKYKQRPKRLHKVTPWEWTPFKNEARTDDLKLFHWQKRPPIKPETKKEGEDGKAQDDTEAEKPQEKPYEYARYNVQIDVPKYDDVIYDGALKSEDWSREETNYLVGLVTDYGQKWPIVWDRYDFVPAALPEGSSTQAPKQRSMEDLKARYYTVRAAVLAAETPIASMNGQQYALYNTLTHFDAKQETSRKRMTEAHLHRSELEVQEETALLAELQRIMMNHTTLEASRKELRDRLDYPSSSNTTQYTTSQALGQLFQQLLAADRSKRDRRLKDLPHVSTNGHPTSHRDSIPGQPGTATSSKRGPRDSLASATSAAEAAAAAAAAHETRSRALSPHSRERFFVTSHDKLPSGITFASDRLSKPRVAKSGVQTERIAAVLNRLRVPDLIPLPTAKVVEAFERLMAKVQGLLEMRKLAEKEEQELRVREAERGIKSEAAAAAAPATPATATEGNGSGNGNGDGEDGARGTKRSVSEVEGGEGDGEGREKRSKSKHPAT